MMSRVLRNASLMALSLALAVVVWVAATNEEHPIRVDSFTTPIPLEDVNVPNGLTVFTRSYDQVALRIGAPSDSWSRLQPTSFQATLDYSGLSTGIHDVEVKVACSDPYVRILDKSPAKVAVRLEHLVSKSVPVQPNIIGAVASGYDLGQIRLEPSTLNVSGAQPAVEPAMLAVVDIPIGEGRSTIKRTAQPYLQTVQGQRIDSAGITLSPPVISVEVPITPTRSVKELPVRANVVGSPPESYWVSDVRVEPPTVTLTGDPFILTELTFVDTEPVSIDGVKGDIVEEAKLKTPTGVSPAKAATVLVKISVSPVPGSQIVRQRIVVRGLGSGLKATVKPEAIDVTLAGSLAGLRNVKPEDVVVEVNVAGLGVGTHTLTPKVTVAEPFSLADVSPEVVTVKIEPIPPP